MHQNYTGTPWDLKNFRDEDGRLILWTSIGGYPVYYMDEEDSILCPECARKSDEDEDEVPQFKIVAGSLFEEGPAIDCDECGKTIESAYGDPDEDEDEEEES